MGSNHPKLAFWISEVISLCQPQKVHYCDGSQEEHEAICQELVAQKAFVPLSKRKNSYWCRSNPADVARVEDRTFICSEKWEDAGPTNHWADPTEMKQKLRTLFKGSMEGRALYIIPFSMGPIGSLFSKIGVQFTDSPYVVANMYIMTRMGKKALDVLGSDGDFIPCLHSVGVPLKKGKKSSFWPCRPHDTYIAHFPDQREIWSFGSGYGGNALLGKKCLALRIASVLGKKEGWMAEHMVIIGVTNPAGKKLFFAAAFPSGCGKTNLAMLQSSLPGWKVECVGDDIAWLKVGSDGKLYAINPESGFFGIASGTSYTSNPYAMELVRENTIFTNTALTDDGDVWWEGMSDKPPEHLTSWRGEDWTPAATKLAAHPNARFTAPVYQCPTIDPAFEAATGVPIAGIIFGGRRLDTVPLVVESRSWAHGVFFGASLSSETTAATAGQVGKVRHDPFAMLPFCGYHMGDYFAHWLNMGERLGGKAPKIYQVNWFLTGKDGKFLWPGFGENIHVLKWMFERCQGSAEGEESPVGILPKNFDGQKELFEVDFTLWKKEVESLRTYFSLFGSRFPTELGDVLDDLQERLSFS